MNKGDALVVNVSLYLRFWLRPGVNIVELRERNMAFPKIDGPLHGLRIIDLTTVVSGPYATQIFADLGAEVIKIEGVGGDLMRSNGVSRAKGFGDIFIASNRNKKSVQLDLKQEDGKN